MCVSWAVALTSSPSVFVFVFSGEASEKINALRYCLMAKLSGLAIAAPSITIIQLTLPTLLTKQYDYLFNLQYQFKHYFQKVYEYIGYLHSYYNNGRQNKDNMISY